MSALENPLGTQASSAAVVRTLLTHFIWRHWRQQPRHSLLLLVLLSLGVAVFFSIRLANRAAVASFASFTGIVAQQTDAILAAPTGPLPDAILEEFSPALKGTGTEIIPVLEMVAASPRTTEETTLGGRAPFTLMGLDLVALQNLADREHQDRKWFDQSANQPKPSPANKAHPNDLWRILALPNAAFCSEALAQKEGLSVGSHLPLVLNDRQIDLEICGLIPERPNQPAAPTNLLILDLPALQTLAGKPGLLDRIEFLFAPGTLDPKKREAILDKIRAVTGTRASVRTPESRRAAAEVMTQGFRLNLTILSLLALLVGLYLIFQALDAAVVRRRPEIATLRALGVGQTEILRTWLLEAAALGLAGGILGVIGGWLLAQGTVRVVSKTVNALYYATNVEAAGLHPGEALLAILLAVACSLAAGWLPAKAASTTPPAQLLNRGSGVSESKRLFHPTKWGGILFLLALALTLSPPIALTGGGHFPLAGYLSALLGILGGGLLAGEGLALFGWLGRPLAKRSAWIQLGNSHIQHPTGRHRWAVAGLLCAVAMTGGMSMLVASFERSVSVWIQHTLQADLYVTSDANQAATSYNRISEASWRKILTHPGVAEADVALILPTELPLGTVRVVGSELAFSQRHNQLTWLVPPRDSSIFDPTKNASLCLVSEAFAERFGTQLGQNIHLPTPAGTQILEIAGIYSDYGDEKGVIMLERRHLSQWLSTNDASTLSLITSPGMDPVQLQAQLRREYPGLAILSNTHLRSEVMRIFRQTFAITYALEGIGVIVALTGLGTTLASILLERKAELTTLRALGMSHAEIAAATAWEGIWIALCGTFGGLVVSLGLGAVLIFVVNKQTFGWTLQPVIPLATLGTLAVSVVACGTAVAWSVGRWGSLLPADKEA